MEKKYGCHDNSKKGFNYDLKNCKLLGVGNNGWVYLIPDGRVIKICREADSCIKEHSILERVKGSKYFPRVYEQCGNYMIRDFVGGECLKDYIKREGLSRKLSINLINLIEEFKKLKFTKCDIRCRDLYIQKNGAIMVIDPRSSFSRKVNYPRHLMKGLRSLGVLGEFLDTVKEMRPDLYNVWNEKFKIYISREKEK